MKTPATIEHKPVTVNLESRLYIIPCAGGYTTHGFDVVERIIAHLKGEGFAIQGPQAAPGTPERYAEYQALCKQVQDLNTRTGFRSTADLTPELIGREGTRVEVTHQWPETGRVETTRFQVGKSTGWMPCHLQLHNRAAHSGPAVCLGKILRVRTISA